MRPDPGLPIELGEVLAKKYRLERVLGEGGAGIVVLAHHLTLDQKVAIKFLRTALANDETRLRFEREARAIGRIESEHVVLVLDYGALPDGAPYMVMEFLDGRDLARVLKEDGPLPVEDAVDCAIQVCLALAEAHASGVVHRDLKPANLFLTRDVDGAPHVKVVDFGISKLLDKSLPPDQDPSDVTGVARALGSPRYMAPEQFRNSRDVDARADLWSLGVVLFQLITGKHAFPCRSMAEAGVKILTGEPDFLTDRAPDVPLGLAEVVRKCLRKDPNERYATALTLAAALRPFASEVGRDHLDRHDISADASSLQMALLVKTPSDVPRESYADGLPALWDDQYTSSSRRIAAEAQAAAAAPRARRMKVAVGVLFAVVLAAVMLSVVRTAIVSARAQGGADGASRPASTAR